MADRPLAVGLAGDDQAHRLLLEKLSDHSLGGGDLSARRAFVGDAEGRPLQSTSNRPQRQAAPSGRPRYRSSRIEGAPAGYAQTIVESVEAFGARASIVLALVDEDGDPTRVADLRRAVDHLARRGTRAVVGLCTPCAEGWLIALIAPHRPHRLRKMESALSFKPAVRPERLGTGKNAGPRHAKRVLAFLLDDEHDDLMRYPEVTPKVGETEPHLAAVELSPSRLRSLTGCGLADFYDGLLRLYVPLFAA